MGTCGALLLPAALLAGLSWGGAGGAAGTDEPPEPPAHVLAEVLSCQPGAPSLSLALTFDSDPLFWFDFGRSSWVPRLAQLPPMPPGLETPEELLLDANLCQELRRSISSLVAGLLPEAKGTPVVSVFPREPLPAGQAGTLVCLAENLFPPAASARWQRNGRDLPPGPPPAPPSPGPGLSFVLFALLEVTPEPGDLFACVVTPGHGNASLLAYWVAQAPAQAEVLESALCGAAMALGTLLALVGISFFLLAQRSARG